MSTESLYDLAEREVAAGLGLDPDADLLPADRIKLAAATSLRLELNRIESEQRAGRAIDVTTMVRASSALAEMMTPASSVNPDLTKLSDAKLAMLEAILAEASGIPLPDPEAFAAEVQARVEATNPQLVRDIRALAELERTRQEGK